MGGKNKSLQIYKKKISKTIGSSEITEGVMWSHIVQKKPAIIRGKGEAPFNPETYPELSETLNLSRQQREANSNYARRLRKKRFENLDECNESKDSDFDEECIQAGLRQMHGDQPYSNDVIKTSIINKSNSDDNFSNLDSSSNYDSACSSSVKNSDIYVTANSSLITRADLEKIENNEMDDLDLSTESQQEDDKKYRKNALISALLKEKHIKKKCDEMSRGNLPSSFCDLTLKDNKDDQKQLQEERLKDLLGKNCYVPSKDDEEVFLHPLLQEKVNTKAKDQKGYRLDRQGEVEVFTSRDFGLAVSDDCFQFKPKVKKQVQ